MEEPASQKLTQTTETVTEPDENENIQNEGDTGHQSIETPAAKENSYMQRGVSHVSIQTRYDHRSKATHTTNETSNKSKMSCKFFRAPSLFLSPEVSVSKSQKITYCHDQIWESYWLVSVKIDNFSLPNIALSDSKKSCPLYLRKTFQISFILS